MKRGRIIQVIITVVCLLITFISVPSYAMDSILTIQEKAEFLDSLKILTGTNGDYLLDKQLSRSEAATIAVRIMGKELHVLKEAKSYENTIYPDVDSSLWYAPYVGFCTTEGILTGDSSGNYRPDDFITEKSFMKIILSILGYEINEDYLWGNIYKKAFEVGLVTDLYYIAKEDDNLEFKRSDAASIIYNALTIQEKSSDKQLFYKLIDSSVITKENAVELGLIQDAIITGIEEILVFDERNISIHFNEEVENIEEILIYEASDEDNVLEFEIEKIEDNYVLLNTEKQISDLKYTIELRNVEDMLGNRQEVLYAFFYGHTPEIIESDFFRIQKVEPVNEQSVKLYFTHPVNTNSEISFYYNILKGNSTIAVGEKDQLLSRIINSENNCVMVSLKNTIFKEDTAYNIEVDGNLTSAYGVKLNNGLGDEIGFTAVEGEEDKFKLERIIPYDQETILVHFNKEINSFLAQQIYNFYITDKKNNPISIELVTIETRGNKAGQALYINVDDVFDEDEEYYLTINNLNDVTRQEYITEMTYSFQADYGSMRELKIKEIDAVDQQTVEVTFNNILDPVSATDNNMYVAIGHNRINPEYVFYDQETDLYKVILYFNDGDLEKNEEYELKVDSSLMDYLGNQSGSVLREDFKSSSKIKSSPSIEEVTPISTDAVRLTFDKEIAFTKTNLSTNNYTLEYNYNGLSIKKVPLSVLYVNARTLVLKFDDLEYDIPYTLKFNTLVDYSGLTYKVTGDGTNYVEFKLEEE